MKKQLILLLTVLTLLLASACGNTQPAKDTDAPAPQTESQSAPAAEDPASDTPLTEFTVVDDSRFSLQITGVDPNGAWGYCVTCRAENRTADQTLTFSASEAAVNGLTCTAMYAEELKPGETKDGNIFFSMETDPNQPLGDYTDISLTFRVKDAEDVFADPMFRDTVHVYPKGKDQASRYVREPQAGDQLLADTEQFSATAISCQNDSFYGFHAILYLVNKTDLPLAFSIGQITVNGEAITSGTTYLVPAGASAFEPVFLTDDLTEVDTEAVEEIEIGLHVLDNDSGETIWQGVGTLHP